MQDCIQQKQKVEGSRFYAWLPEASVDAGAYSSRGRRKLVFQKI